MDILVKVSAPTKCAMESYLLIMDPGFSVPIGCVALILLVTAMPKRLQTEPAASEDVRPFWHGFAPDILKRIDFLGALLLLGACLLLVTVLQQATAGISFTARNVLPLLILSGVMWIAFFVWQWYAATQVDPLEPVLPWRLLTNRVFLGMILYVCLIKSKAGQYLIFF